jgi:hypothetical protein
MKRSLSPLALLAVLLLPVQTFAQAPAPAAPAAERAEITVPEATLAQYVGNYEIAPNFIMAVTVKDGQLMTQATGQGEVPVFAETETRFYPKLFPATLEFQKDANGVVTGLVLEQNGNTMNAPKK